MPVAATSSDFLALVRKSGLIEKATLDNLFHHPDDLPEDPQQCAAMLVRTGLLTTFQSRQLLAGKTRGFFLGAFRILQPIGQGGMGAVFLAEQSILKRKVAMKILPAVKAQNKLVLERFQREARSAAALDHPNIVRVHDLCQSNGLYYLIMEYVDGVDLQSLMAKTGALHFAQAVEYVAQAATGLQHAHEKGVVHRDIKPGNLILSKQGVVKILDMGLARSFMDEEDRLTEQLGEATDVAGTADYISPEQALNQELDGRSDIYSLGVTLFALMTGHPPFRGTTAQKLMQHQIAEPPSLTKLRGVIPPPLSAVVAKMMQKKSSDRYASMGEVLDALAPWLPAPTTNSLTVSVPHTAEIPSPATPTVSNPSEPPALPKTASSRVTPAEAPREVPAAGPRKLLIPALAAALLLVGIAGGIAFLSGVFDGGHEETGPLAARTITPATASVEQRIPPSAIVPRQQAANAQALPIAPSPRPVLFHSDFQETPPFEYVQHEHTKLDKSLSLPSGWAAQIYHDEITGRFSVAQRGNSPCFGSHYLSGKTSALQTVFDLSKVPDNLLSANKIYDVHLDIYVERDQKAQLAVQLMPDPNLPGSSYPSIDLKYLPATNGWQRATLRLSPVAGQRVQIVVKPTFLHPTSGVWVRSMDIVEAAPQPPLETPRSRSIYYMNLQALTASSFTYDGATRTKPNEQGMEAPLPQCWSYSHPEPSSTSAYELVKQENEVYIRFRRLTGDVGPMMSLTNGTVLAQDRKHRVTMEYRTEAGFQGVLEFQPNPLSAPEQWKLPATGGNWVTQQFEVASRDENCLSLFRIRDTSPETTNNDFAFRKFMISALPKDR